MDSSRIDEIYRTGRGSIKIRAKYTVDEKAGCITVTEIPYTTTIEAIIDKIVDLVKTGKLKEISDIKDMSDLKGLKIRIELKRASDPYRIMSKLFKMTPLEDTFGCNFNILIAGMPRVLGVREILEEWESDPSVEVNLTIDNPQPEWDGHVGFIPNYVKELNPDTGKTVLMCGPPVMIKFTLAALKELGFKENQVYTTMELRMKCGIGKCGRCNIGPKYVCKDGPVFRFDQLDELPDEY